MRIQQYTLAGLLLGGMVLSGCTDTVAVVTFSDPKDNTQEESALENTSNIDDVVDSSNNDESQNNNSSSNNNTSNSNNDVSEPLDNNDTNTSNGNMSTTNDEQGKPIYSLYDNKLCLDVNQQTLMAQTCNNSAQQNWIIDEQSIRPTLAPNYCITASSLNNVGQLSLQLCQPDKIQLWQLSNQSLLNGNWALDLNRTTKQVGVYQYHGGNNQKWGYGVNDSAQADDSDNQNNGQLENQEPEKQEPETNEEDQWSNVKVLPTGSYGINVLTINAARNWVNSGLYLKKGQSVKVTANGQWKVNGDKLYGPQGHATATSRGCAEGSLVARIGLYYKDVNIYCIGSAGEFIAHTDGIVYIGAVVSNDLGEAYETRKDAQGAIEVTIESSGLTVPIVDKNMASFYDYQQIASGWVEIRSPYTILTLPTSTAIKDKAKLQGVMQRIDDIYAAHESLRGAVPHHGQPIRWFPDTEDAPGWMLAGNPIRMDPALVDANSSSRMTLLTDPGEGAWGVAHELGHDFNFVGGDWYYTSSTAGLETWPNIFSVHAQETLDLPRRSLECDTKAAQYKSSGSYENDFKKDPWLSLCFLMEFKDRYGWDFYKDFYAEFNENPAHGWKNIHDKFEMAAGEDIMPIFNEWRIPL